MRIRCWGARGSIPVSGPDYIAYGGDTTCLEIRAASGDIIIIDCGSGVRRLGNELLREKQHRLNILFTHVHWDHISGFPFFKPLYHRSTTINIYGSDQARQSIQSMLAQSMAAPFFPIALNSVSSCLSFTPLTGDEITIGSIRITPIPLNHPNGGFGFKLSENGKVFVFLTDNELEFGHPGGLGYGEYLDFCRGADLLVHDAEFTDTEYVQTRSWGHSRYLKALELAHRSEERSCRERV